MRTFKKQTVNRSKNAVKPKEIKNVRIYKRGSAFCAHRNFACAFCGKLFKKHKDKESGNDWDFASMGPIFGVAIGIAVGTVNENIGAALGAGIGMFIGTLIEFFIGKNKA